ncbi:hypothetical protein ES703_76334 [subsurface metagenome]
MSKNHLFFFKRYFDFFKNKYLAPGLMFLAMFLLICCFEVPKSKYLSVPHITWKYSGWCAPACVQMWAWFEGSTYLTQDQIAPYTGWSGATVYTIANAVTRFTSKTGFAALYYNTYDQQDAAISTQIASIKSGVPSISIVHDGSHSVIVIGFEWTELSDGTPRADWIKFNDPARTKSLKVAAWYWKNDYFFPNRTSGKYEIVLTNPSYVNDGYEGHQEFKARGGTYYGDPDRDREKPTRE